MTGQRGASAGLVFTMFHAQQSSTSLTIGMSAELGHIDQADQRITAWLTEEDVPVDHFQVRLLMREAMLNGVVHGCGKDASREVRLGIERDDETITMRVTDGGPGFDWGDRGLDVDILGDGGRGLPLMRIYADSVVFNAAGNQITLTKNLRLRAA